MTRDEAIALLMGGDEYIRYSVKWGGTEEQQASLVLDGDFTADHLEALLLIMRNEPDLFTLRENS